MSPLHDAQVNGHIPKITSVDYNLISDIPPSPSPSAREVSTSNSDNTVDTRHVIKLSGMENCMPRAYIRVCLAYPVPHSDALPSALEDLKGFVRRIVDAKPYLAGYVVPACNPEGPVGRVELQFTNQDFLDFNPVQERAFTKDEMPFTYADLDRLGLPPSTIRPELVSALSEGADEDRAPALRVQANIIDGGLIISFYLHHCISDGTGLGLILSGSVLKDDFTFERHLHTNGHPVPTLTTRLAEYANFKNCVRAGWSYSSPNQINTRHLRYKLVSDAMPVSTPTNAAGRGCIFAFPVEMLLRTKASLNELLNPTQRSFLENSKIMSDSKPTRSRHDSKPELTKNDTLQALLWHHMTRARIPSLSSTSTVENSKLLIPVNIRDKLKPELSPHYFGAAVDFASATLPLKHLMETDTRSLSSTAFLLRKSILEVDDAYIRSAIALATSKDRDIDVRDLLASNMDRVTGADMYITSWERFDCYTAELGMKLGPPDWVRKPWSRDPGSCIVLPRDHRKNYIEAVVQMTTDDMGRLLEDKKFMSYVNSVIE